MRADAASMGPPSGEGGNVLREATRPGRRSTGFNGASLGRGRKQEQARARALDGNRLQWGLPREREETKVSYRAVDGEVQSLQWGLPREREETCR